MEKILISCLSYVETALLRGRGGGGVITQLTRIKWVGRSLPHSLAEKTEQEGVFCSDSVFIGRLRHITHYCTLSNLWGVTMTYFNSASHCYESMECYE